MAMIFTRLLIEFGAWLPICAGWYFLGRARDYAKRQREVEYVLGMAAKAKFERKPLS